MVLKKQNSPMMEDKKIFIHFSFYLLVRVKQAKLMIFSKFVSSFRVCFPLDSTINLFCSNARVVLVFRRPAQYLS